MQQAVDEDGYIWNVDASGNAVGQPVGRVDQQPAPQPRQGPAPFTVGTPRAPEAPKPYRFQSNDGSLWEVGPDGQPRQVFQDAPAPKPREAPPPKTPQEMANVRADAIAKIKLARDLGKRSRDGWFTTGFGSGIASSFSGTPAYDLAQDTETLKNAGALQRIMEMAQTNGGKNPLTPLSNSDFQALATSLTNLDPGQSDDQYQKNLKVVEDLYMRAYVAAGGDAAQINTSGRDNDAAGAFLTGINGGGQGGPNGPTVLPTANGARPDPGINSNGVVAKARGGFTQVPSLRGIDQAVIDMVGQGRSGPEIVKFLDEAYKATETEHGGSLRVSPGLADFVGQIVDLHRNQPDKPIRSLGQQWEILSGYETPDKDQSFLGALMSPGDWGGYAADTDTGNLAMTSANAATAGLPAYLAGDSGNAVMAASRMERPKTSFAGEVIGGTAGMVGANRLLGSLGRVGAATARYGGGVATDVGFGATRGGLEHGPAGALVGALAAGTGNVVGRYGVAPAARGLLDTRAGQALANTVTRGTNALANGGRGLFGRAPVPHQPVNIPPPLPRGERTAMARLPDDAEMQLNEAARMGLPMAPADLSPELQMLTGSAVRKSTAARDMAENTLRPRQLGQADRAQEQIARNFGPVNNPNEISDQLLQRARQDAAPLYDAFRAQPARTSDELTAMLGTPAGTRALANARNIAANEGRDPNALGFDLDQQGNVILRSDPSPETLDLVKRGFDDVINDYRDTTTGVLNLNDQGRAIKGLRQRFVGEVDRLYPNYAAARRAYAGPAGESEALQTGRNMANALARDIQPRLQNYTPGQQEQFRLGQRVAMSDSVDRARLTSNPYERVYGSPIAQARAATVFGQGPAANFGRAHQLEGNMARTAQEALGGSPTAARLAADEAFDGMVGDAVEAGTSVLTGGGGMGGLVQRASRGLRDNIRLRGGEQRGAELAPLLLNTDPAAMAALIARLRQSSALRNNYVQRTREAGGIFGRAAGASLPATVQ